MKSILTLVITFIVFSVKGQQAPDVLHDTQSFIYAKENSIFTLNPMEEELTIKVWDITDGVLKETIVIPKEILTTHIFRTMKVNAEKSEINLLFTSKANTYGLGILTINLKDRSINKNIYAFKDVNKFVEFYDIALGRGEKHDMAQDNSRKVGGQITQGGKKEENYFILKNKESNPPTWRYEFPTEKKYYTEISKYLKETNELFYIVRNTKSVQMEVFRKVCDVDDPPKLIQSFGLDDYYESSILKFFRAEIYTSFTSISFDKLNYIQVDSKENHYILFKAVRFDPVQLKIGENTIKKNRGGWTTDKIVFYSLNDFSFIKEFKLPEEHVVQDIDLASNRIIVSDENGTHKIYDMKSGQLIQTISLMNDNLTAFAESERLRLLEEEKRKKTADSLAFWERTERFNSQSIQELKQDVLKKETAQLPIYKTINGIDIKYKEGQKSIKVGKKWFYSSVLDVYLVNTSDKDKNGTYGVLAEGKGWNVIGGSLFDPVYEKSGRKFSGNFCLSPGIISSVSKDLTDIQSGLSNLEIMLEVNEGECSE